MDEVKSNFLSYWDANSSSLSTASIRSSLSLGSVYRLGSMRTCSSSGRLLRTKSIVTFSKLAFASNPSQSSA